MNKLLASVLGVLLVLGLVGCVTLSPEAEKVSVVDNASAVRGCKSLGTVRGVERSNNMPNDDKRSLQNEAGALGADTLLITHRAYFNSAPTGVAYLCGNTAAPATPK